MKLQQVLQILPTKILALLEETISQAIADFKKLIQSLIFVFSIKRRNLNRW